jgi:hypothetical protein
MLRKIGSRHVYVRRIAYLCNQFHQYTFVHLRRAVYYDIKEFVWIVQEITDSDTDVEVDFLSRIPLTTDFISAPVLIGCLSNVDDSRCKNLAHFLLSKAQNKVDLQDLLSESMAEMDSDIRLVSTPDPLEITPPPPLPRIPSSPKPKAKPKISRGRKKLVMETMNPPPTENPAPAPVAAPAGGGAPVKVSMEDIVGRSADTHPPTPRMYYLTAYWKANGWIGSADLQCMVREYTEIVKQMEDPPRSPEISTRSPEIRMDAQRIRIPETDSEPDTHPQKRKRMQDTSCRCRRQLSPRRLDFDSPPPKKRNHRN